ncbi:GATOR2 complex protein WDR24-like [Branchiostoma floridae x Branchiostoma japonicum]
MANLKEVRDRVMGSMGRTMYTHVAEGPINALSTCKDGSQVVLAGRNVFKIYGIEDEEFTERANLRVGRKLSLNFSCADVAWHQLDDNLLATAATNGAVITWNLSKSSRSKQDQVFTEHKRTVNKVCFHPTELHVLLSGSQDGTVKLFDLRKKESASTFHGRSESVRDVQFNPHRDYYFSFASTHENGNVLLWDLRRPDKAERFFTAHSGPVFCCDFHPDDKSWLATAGRDKAIKVWEVVPYKQIQEVHCVQTIASVGRIKWRPQRRYHIASCSLLVDFSINIWDIRRPYIPFAAFEEHRDVTTGITWRQDPHIFLSCSKDCTVYQHVFRDAKRPADHANPMGLCFNVRGDISFAASEALGGGARGKGGSGMYASTRLPSFFRKNPDPTEQFRSVNSNLSVFTNRNQENPTAMDWFVKTAENYCLTGRPLSELCEHNAQVARQLGRHQIVQTWLMLKLIFAGLGAVSDKGVVTSPSLGRIVSLSTTGGQGDLLDRLSQHNETSTVTDMQEAKSAEPPGITKEKDPSEPGDAEPKSALPQPPATDNPAHADLTHVHGDFFFGDGEGGGGYNDYDSLPNMDHIQDWTLPGEAFQPRHEIIDRNPSPEELDRPDSPTSINESETVSLSNEKFLKGTVLTPTPTNPSFLDVRLLSPLVVDMLHHYAQQGDVQMTVSVMIVLGDHLKDQIEEQIQEHWLMSYVDMLGCFKLWMVATEIVKLSYLIGVPSVGTLNQNSTSIHSNCNHCSKPLTQKGWLCTRCQKLVNTCSVCHHVVKGLYVWCQGCSHGGHIHHIQEWLRTNQQCPAGCGHCCQYT